MNGSAKYVVSGTLKSADWQNSTLIPRDRAAGEIAELKHQPGKNIGMTGSAALVSWLLRQGLPDELQLLVFPVVLGSGKPLFGNGGGGQLPLKTRRSKNWPQSDRRRQVGQAPPPFAGQTVSGGASVSVA